MQKYVWTAIFIVIIISVIIWSRGAKPTTVTPDPAVEGAQAEVTPSLEPVKTEEPTTVTSNKTTTMNGMTIEVIKEGTGAEIKNGQTAVVQYEGKLVDGTIFDSTAKRNNTPFEFPLGAGMVIKGWDQGVLGMKVGEARKLTIPFDLAYGVAGRPPVIPPSATLIFTVTLEGIK